MTVLKQIMKYNKKLTWGPNQNYTVKQKALYLPLFLCFSAFDKMNMNDTE